MASSENYSSKHCVVFNHKTRLFDIVPIQELNFLDSAGQYTVAATSENVSKAIKNGTLSTVRSSRLGGEIALSIR